jgi:acetylornithine deacetylase
MIQSQRLKRLLQRLVDIYSPSGKEEQILSYLRGYLKREGLPVLAQPVDEHRYNLIVMPPDAEVRLALVGHLDTVTAHDLDRYGFTEQGDLIRGLGTADMKAGCAAMIEAYEAVWASGNPKPPVALCLLVGEEEDGDGAERLVEEYHFPWAVIGEPTNLEPCLSHYGYLEIHISSHGKRVHASLANLAKNPITSMFRLMLEISRHMEKIRPEVVYNIRDLYSSQSGFAVPDRCEAWLDLHMPPDAPIGETAAELEEIVTGEKSSPAPWKASFRIETIDSGYTLPERGVGVDALKAAFSRCDLSWKPGAFRSHSDANRLWSAGIKPILFGPGRLEDAHTPDEAVSFQQVIRAGEVYKQILLALKQ